MEIFEEEEKSFASPYGHIAYRTGIISRGWETGNFWYFHALKSPKGLYNLFEQHIQPIFENTSKIGARSFAQTISHIGPLMRGNYGRETRG
jgi:hypothetical protein